MLLYEFFDHPREGMGFLGEKNVEEGDLDKFKKYTRPVVKTKPKIERTTNPAGRTNDHVEWKVTTPTGEIHRYKSKKQAQEHFDSFGSQGVAEVAPPGAKAERMVRHIKQGYAKDGKLTPKEKGIAFATAWKAHNAGQVEEQGVTEGSDSGPVEAYGYRYNNRDQRIVWRKIFPSGEAAYAWADRNNATVLGTRSTEQR